MTDLESAISNSAKAGRLNHLTLAIRWDGIWEACYRGVATDDHRMATHKDPVAALTAALTGRKAPEAAKPKRAPKARPQDDNEDIL